MTADGTPSPSTVDLSAPGRRAGAPALALGAHSSAIWRRFDGAGDVVQAWPTALPGRAAASLSPGSHSFGAVSIGATGQTGEFELGNTGEGPLSVLSITIAGPDAGDFALAGEASCLGGPLEPGAGCLFTVDFAPRSPGEKSASIEVVSDAASSPDVVALSGSGAAVQIPEGGTEPPGSPGAPESPGPGALALAAGSPSISNTFAVGKISRDRRRGTARLRVWVPGPGTLIAAGPRVITVKVAEAGTVPIRVRARGPKLRRLKRGGRVTVGVVITFIPYGGEPATRAKWVKLVRARRATHRCHRRAHRCDRGSRR